MTKIVPLLLIMALTACGDRGHVNSPSEVPVTVVQTTTTAVDAPCVPDTYNPVDPDYVDSDAKLKGAADAAERYQLLWGGRAQRIKRDAEKTIIIAGCPRGPVNKK